MELHDIWIFTCKVITIFVQRIVLLLVLRGLRGSIAVLSLYQITGLQRPGRP